MKIAFRELEITGDNIQVSFDNKNTFENYDKNTALAEGIPVPEECTDFNNIVVKADKSEITDLVYEMSTDVFNQGNLYSRLDKRIKNLKIPDGITYIGDYTFAGCSSLISIAVPKSVTSIGELAFSGCSNLTSIIIPDSVTYIGTYAFENCSNLTSINIPNSSLYINSCAFEGCSSLTSIYIPDLVKSISSSAFDHCDNLTSIIVSRNNAYYSSDEYALYNKDGTKIIKLYNQSIDNFIIPNTVTSTGNNAFQGCRNLTNIQIPNSVTSIGLGTFSSCRNLTSIEIPNSVTSIGSGAFWGCSSLTSISIPGSVTSIGEMAFQNCSKLTTINYMGTEEQWNNITKDNDWNSGCPAVVNYNYVG